MVQTHPKKRNLKKTPMEFNAIIFLIIFAKKKFIKNDIAQKNNRNSGKMDRND